MTPGGRKERQSFRYEAFVPDPIARLEFALPAQIAATVSAAELQVDLLNRDPPAMASLEVLARRLLRAESVASSRIEGLVLSQRRLAKAEAEGLEKRDETARSVVSNVAAMEEAVKLGAKDRPLKTRDIVALHRILMKATSTPGVAGKLRDRQNWIGGNAFNPGRSASGAPSSPSRSSSRRQRQWSWQIALSPFRIHGVNALAGHGRAAVHVARGPEPESRPQELIRLPSKRPVHAPRAPWTRPCETAGGRHTPPPDLTSSSNDF